MKIKMILLLQLLSLVIIAQTNYIKNTDIQFVNNNFGSVIRNDGIISITKNGGINWTQSLVEKDVYLRNIFFVDEVRGWITTKDRLFKTNDAGHTWCVDSSITDLQYESILFINDSTGFIGGQSTETMDYENKIFVTRNFGNSWSETNIDTNYYNGILEFSFINDSIGIAVGSSTIYKTIDGGNNWNQLSVDYGIPYMISSARMIDKNKILGFIAFPDVVFEGYIIISNDGGLTWDKYGNKQNFRWGITDQYFFSIDNGWLTTASKIYHTVNSGSSWDTLQVNVSKFNYFDANNALGINDKEILLTNDAWNTFSIVDTIVTDIIPNEKTITNQFILSQNYPNPFNPTTTIKYTIPSSLNNSHEIVSLKVFNILGNEITTLVNEKQMTGHYKVTFDAKDLPSGVYFYKLQSGNFSSTEKMILLK